MQVIQYDINPSAGFAIAFISSEVIRGGKKPLVVLVTSSAEEGAGVVVPIPTWARPTKLVAIKAKLSINFFTFFVLNWIPFLSPQRRCTEPAEVGETIFLPLASVLVLCCGWW
jgi:hypothetical protein